MANVPGRLQCILSIVGYATKFSLLKVLLKFFMEFETSLTYVYPITESIFCLGDFNIDILDSASVEAKYVNGIFESFRMEQLMSRPTTITANIANLTDYIVISNKDIVSDYGTIHAPEISDHEIVYYDIGSKIRFKQTFVTKNMRLGIRRLKYIKLRRTAHLGKLQNLRNLVNAGIKLERCVYFRTKLGSFQNPKDTSTAT
nr:unnamed protein product [Callosobruchus analis]